MLDAVCSYACFEIAWSVCLRHSDESCRNGLTYQVWGQTSGGPMNHYQMEYIWTPPSEYDKTMCAQH